jgi:AraC family transcriptional activator of pobA
MGSTASIPTFTIHDLEMDVGKVEFAITRIEAMSVPVLRNALLAHRADFYQIVWGTTVGAGKFWIDLDSYDLRPNIMCFISPGQIHCWEYDTRAKGYVIGFTSGFFSNSPDDANALIQMPYFHGVGAAPVLYADQELADLFTHVCRGLEREIQLALDGQTALLHSYMRILLVEARRAHQATPGATHLEEAAVALTKQFTQLLEAHYLTTTSVADYATMLHVTTNHLIETVRRCVGLPPGKIIHERLLLEAKRLLRYSDLPVTEIATELSFEDPSYFSRFFKKHTGLSPSEFREQP